MTDQRQDAKAGALAVQSGRDTVIRQGLTPADMRQILDALGAQFPAQLAAAREIVDARLADFEKRILERFTVTGGANPQAFADPDFQYVVRTSQHAYARTGDSQVRDTLIDLIASRSNAGDRTRLQLTLNEAVDKAALLTRNEFAELSLCYLIKYTASSGIGNIESFAAYFGQHITPLLGDISIEQASYQYIEAQSCGNLGISYVDPIEVFRRQFGGIFSKGFEPIQLEGHLPSGKDVLNAAGLVIPCLNDPTKLQLKAINKDAFLRAAAGTGLGEAEITNVWAMFEGTIWTGEEFLKNVEPRVPAIRTLSEVWKKSGLGRLTLTTVGIAIGHANLVRVGGFSADLGIWIK